MALKVYFRLLWEKRKLEILKYIKDSLDEDKPVVMKELAKRFSERWGESRSKIMDYIQNLQIDGAIRINQQGEIAYTKKGERMLKKQAYFDYTLSNIHPDA